MSHPEQLAFVNLVSSLMRHNNLISVLEIGSYDVNGSIRRCFPNVANWMGVDLVQGPGVDLVEFGHKVNFPPKSFDLSISCECFEHDEFWRDTFENMLHLTKPGGVVVFTCASRGRPEHGTRRSQPTLSPGTHSRSFEYYKNLSERDFLECFDFASWFSIWSFWYNPWTFDLYFVGQLSGKEGVKLTLPTKGHLKQVFDLTPMTHRIIRIPLYISLHLFPSSLYEFFARNYWKTLLRLEHFVFKGRMLRHDANSL